MTVPAASIGRRERFKAAVALARTTVGAWAETQGVSVTHLNEVLSGNRTGGAELNAAIDSFINEFFPA